MNNFAVIRFSINLKPNAHPMWALARKKISEQFNDRESWFQYRVNLFKETYDSLLKQTKPFNHIFLIFDADDQHLYEKYIKPIYKIVPVFDSCGNWKKLYVKEISKVCQSNIVISRIDSDDLLDTNYVESVNKSIVGNHNLIVIAPCGHINDGTYTQEIIWNTSPFISLFASKYMEEDVYALSHMMSLTYPHVFAPRALWTQRIHGSNVDNKFYDESPGFKEISSKLMSHNAEGEMIISEIETPFLNVGQKQRIIF